jgi:hypothetical protein
MPRILEFKEIDGALWVKLDIDLATTPQPIGLYTPDEEAGLIKEERARCVAIVNAARSGEIDSDLRCVRSRIESGEPFPEPDNS